MTTIVHIDDSSAEISVENYKLIRSIVMSELGTTIMVNNFICHFDRAEWQIAIKATENPGFQKKILDDLNALDLTPLAAAVSDCDLCLTLLKRMVRLVNESLPHAEELYILLDNAKRFMNLWYLENESIEIML